MRRKRRRSWPEIVLNRVTKMGTSVAASETEVDRARAERDVALAEVARIKAVMARKTIRAPFRARVGISDVHPGQYPRGGDPAHDAPGHGRCAACGLQRRSARGGGAGEGDRVEVVSSDEAPALEAKIVAVDARVDPATRNAMVRAIVKGARPRPRARLVGARARPGRTPGHGRRRPGHRAAQRTGRRPRLRRRPGSRRQAAGTDAPGAERHDARRRGADLFRPVPRRARRGSRLVQAPRRRARRGCDSAARLPDCAGYRAGCRADYRARSQVIDRFHHRNLRMRSFTDVFIRHPVLAVVVNLVIVLVGWRALMSLPVQQYPKVESSSVLITTVYTGAGASRSAGFSPRPSNARYRPSAASTTSNRPAAPESASSRCA